MPNTRRLPITLRPALYAEWARGVPPQRSRHAAINRNLATWDTYQSWSERMKGVFKADLPQPARLRSGKKK